MHLVFAFSYGWCRSLPGPSQGISSSYQPRQDASVFAPDKTGDRISSGSAGWHPLRPVSWKADKPESVVVVPVVRVVPVAVRRPAILGIVVPRAAPQNPDRASGGNPKPLDDICTKISGIRHSGKLNEWFHVAYQFIFGPFTCLPSFFILFKF
jgi:hypothetical protein